MDEVMHNPMLHRFLIDAQTDEYRRAARRRAAVPGPQLLPRRAVVEQGVTLRYAFPDDRGSLSRLAQLDCAEALPEPVLVAEVAGTLRAAVSLRDGTVIADPFHRSSALVELLRARAAQLQRSEAADGRGRRWAGLRSRFGLAAGR